MQKSLTSQILTIVKEHGSIKGQELARIMGKPTNIISGLTSSLTRRGQLTHDKDTHVYSIGNGSYAYILVYPMNKDHMHGQVFDTREELTRNMKYLDFDDAVAYKATRLR